MGRWVAGVARQVSAHRAEHDGPGHRHQQQRDQELQTEAQTGYQER